MSLLRIAGPQVRGMRVVGTPIAIAPLILYSLAGDLQQRQCSGDGLPNRKRKSGSLKEPLFRNIIGPFTPDEARTFKAVVGHGLYPLHPALASPVRFVYSPLVIPLPTPSSLGGV